MKNKKCNNCKNLQQTVYMKLENETLYSIWCKVGNIEGENCDKFISKGNLFKANKVNFNCDKCGKEIKYSGIANLKHPPVYEHICECGEIYWLDNVYPNLEFELDEELSK